MNFDNSGLDIKKKDFLWRFYRKSFELDNKPVEKPKNICRYFWTSMRGIALWFSREVKLWKLWSVSALSFLLVFIADIFLTGEFFKPYDSIAYILAVILMLILMLIFTVSVALPMYLSVSRFFDWAYKKPGVQPVSIVIVLAAVAVVGWARRETFFSNLVEDFKLIMSLLPYALGIPVLLALLFYLFNKLFPNNSVGRVVKTFTVYMQAKKNQVCLPVKAPSSFKEDSKEN